MEPADEDEWWTAGHAARRRGVFDEALDAYNRAAETARDGHRPERELEARLYAADCARRLGRLQACETQLHTAVEVGRRRGLTGLLARALGELGSLAVSTGDVRVGAAWYREALELAERAGDDRTMATQQGNLGLLALQRGDHGVARDLLRKRLDTILTLRAVNEAADTLTTLAEVELAMGDPVAAQKSLHRSLSLRRGKRTASAVRGVACSLILLARIAREQGRLKEADTLAERALHAAEAAKATREIAHAHLQLGCLAKAWGRRQEARVYLEFAAEGLRSSGDTLQGLVADVALAGLAIDDGQFEDARNAYMQAATGFRAQENHTAAVDATLLAAQLDARMGNLADAEQSLRDALIQAKTLEYDAAITRIEVNLASVQVATGHVEAGVAGCLSGARRFETLNRVGDQAMALLGAGEALMNTDRLDAAETIFSEARVLLGRLSDTRAVRVVDAWLCHIKVKRLNEPRDVETLSHLCDALEDAGDVALAMQHRLTLAMRPDAPPTLMEDIAAHAERVHLWPLQAEARAWLARDDTVALEALAAEAEARGYLTLSMRIRADRS